MRYVTLRITPTEGAAFHPLGQQLADEPDIVREAVHRVELLADDTGIMLAEARGDQARYEALMDDSEYVHDYAVTGADGRWYAYVHFEALDRTREMLRHRRESEVMMEMPVEVSGDGTMELTFVGDESGFADAVPMAADSYDVEVVETGSRSPQVDDLFAALTERQQEILDVAAEMGYYENPREATHADVAAAVDTSPSTVGEHLRKIESRVFSQFVRE